MNWRQVFTLVMAIFAVASIRPPATSVAAMATPHVIRLRVIANSDNPIDQAIKLDVRDRVLETLDPLLNGVATRKIAVQRIEALRGELGSVANAVLSAHHVDYRARVQLTTTQFPTKAYGTWVLPAGRYQALLITLGKGQGHNWWCVLYPSLCFVDMGNALAVRQAPVSIVTPVTVGLAVRHHDGHQRHPRAVAAGRIRVSWTTPRFLRELLAILH